MIGTCCRGAIQHPQLAMTDVSDVLRFLPRSRLGSACLVLMGHAVTYSSQSPGTASKFRRRASINLAQIDGGNRTQQSGKFVACICWKLKGKKTKPRRGIVYGREGGHISV